MEAQSTATALLSTILWHLYANDLLLYEISSIEVFTFVSRSWDTNYLSVIHQHANFFWWLLGKITLATNPFIFNHFFWNGLFWSSFKQKLRKPQTDIPILISIFNITGLYGVLMSVLGFSKYNIQPKSGTQPNWKHLADARF